MCFKNVVPIWVRKRVSLIRCEAKHGFQSRTEFGCVAQSKADPLDDLPIGLDFLRVKPIYSSDGQGLASVGRRLAGWMRIEGTEAAETRHRTDGARHSLPQVSGPVFSWFLSFFSTESTSNTISASVPYGTWSWRNQVTVWWTSCLRSSIIAPLTYRQLHSYWCSSRSDGYCRNYIGTSSNQDTLPNGLRLTAGNCTPL